MPVTLKQVISNTARVTLRIRVAEDEVSDLNVVYYPARVTEETFAHLQAFDSLGTDFVAGFKSLNEVLISLIKSWDFFEDDKQTIMYPLEANALKKVPIVFRIAVLQGIMQDIRPEQTAPQILS